MGWGSRHWVGWGRSLTSNHAAARRWSTGAGAGWSGARCEAVSPYDYDERQYCSPSFCLQVSCFLRTSFGEFAEWHASADNLDFVQPKQLTESPHLEPVLHLQAF